MKRYIQLNTRKYIRKWQETKEIDHRKPRYKEIEHRKAMNQGDSLVIVIVRSLDHYTRRAFKTLVDILKKLVIIKPNKRTKFK